MASDRIGFRQRALNGKILTMSKDIAKKYQNGDIELAQIATEGIINLKKTVAALEILNLYIQTFKTRVDSLNYEEKVPANMRKYIASILFCDGRVEIKELSTICAQIRRRYGAALSDLAEDVDPRISSRLTPCIPNPSDVSETLQDILRKNGVSFQSLEPEVNPFTQFITESINNPAGATPSLPQPPAPGPLPPAFPGVPGVPGVPSVPSVPGVPSVPNVPNVPGVADVPSSPGVPSAFPMMPSDPAIPPLPSDPLTPPSGFGAMAGEPGTPHGAFPPMPPSVPSVPNVPSMPNDPSGMSGMGGMNAFPTMQPTMPKPFPAVQMPFSMEAPNQPGMDGRSDADDYMKKLNSFK